MQKGKSLNLSAQSDNAHCNPKGDSSRRFGKEFGQHSMPETERDLFI